MIDNCYRSRDNVGNKAKRGISKRVFQESKAHQNFRKTNISYPLIRTRTSAYQEVKNVCFSEILACFAFLKHPRFAFLPYYRRKVSRFSPVFFVYYLSLVPSLLQLDKVILFLMIGIHCFEQPKCKNMCQIIY